MKLETYNVTIETLDGSFITDRTGKSKVKGIVHQKPRVGFAYYCVFYNEGEAIHPDSPSPGVAINVDHVENIGNEYRITDRDGRKFKVVLEENNG